MAEKAMSQRDLFEALCRMANAHMVSRAYNRFFAVPLTVESARPLDVQQLERLCQAAGVPVAQTSHRVEPTLHAGVRVVSARGLVDVSATGFAASAEHILIERMEEDRESLEPVRDG